ncbi:hypothetical protein H0H93_008256 [Arthromyces matolae]|nr:hypothetical protein H0H93_008256 [Arthromyces matolae]
MDGHKLDYNNRLSTNHLSFTDMPSFNLPYTALTRLAASFSLPRRSSSEPPVHVAASPSINQQETTIHPVAGPSTQPIDPIPRVPSPTPTEILEPEPEDILEAIQKLGIKVNDYAYSTPSSTNTSRPATEIFDPWKGIAEFEYRLRSTTYIKPIPGKVTSRLLAIHWVTEEEIQERLRPIDWEELESFTARGEAYQWRPCKFTAIPTVPEREPIYAHFLETFTHRDKYIAGCIALTEYREKQRLYGEEMGRRIEESLREQARENEILRRELEDFGDDFDDDVDMVDADVDVDDVDVDANWVPSIEGAAETKKRALEFTASTEKFAPKRVKLSNTSNAIAGPSSSQPAARTTRKPLPPLRRRHLQQYPAPVQAYDPRIYPDAARIIAAQNRKPVVLSGDPTPPNSDDESDDTDADANMAGRCGPGAPLRRKKKKKGLKRTLSRTQSFAQL